MDRRKSSGIENGIPGLSQENDNGLVLIIPSLPDPPASERHSDIPPRLGTLRQIVRDPELAEKIIAENSVTARNRERAMRRLSRHAMFYS